MRTVYSFKEPREAMVRREKTSHPTLKLSVAFPYNWLALTQPDLKFEEKYISQNLNSKNSMTTEKKMVLRHMPILEIQQPDLSGSLTLQSPLRDL